LSINSNTKGKAGERELANLFKDYGFKQARRSQQYAGINNDADLAGVPMLHVEVKRVERLNIDKAVEQMQQDKRDDELGIVAHRKNGKPWKVTMTFDEFMEIYKRYLITLEE
jgi:Holliday junction resolvase